MKERPSYAEHKDKESKLPSRSPYSAFIAEFREVDLFAMIYD